MCDELSGNCFAKVVVMEELYINGQLVDLVSSGITFNLKSNLLGEFGKIVAGSSNTVKLPRTVKNMRILDYPEVVSRDGKMIRKKLSARLYRNGIPIIEKGDAKILAVNADSYDISITYGVVSFLSELKDGGNLNELPDAGEYVEWNEYSLLESSEYLLTEYNWQYGFAEYDNGVNDVSKCNNTPLVSIEWLMQKIEAAYNFSFLFADGKREDLLNKYILLTSKNGSKEATDARVGSYDVAGHTYINRLSGECLLPKVFLPNHNISVNQWNIIFNQDVSSFFMTFFFAFAASPSGVVLQVVRNETAIGRSYTFGDGLDFYFSLEGGTMKEGDTISFRLYGYEAAGSPKIINANLQLRCNYVWTDGMEPDDVVYPGSYGIIKNLPNIKITDFIKIIGTLSGTFPLVNNGDTNVLQMVSVDDLLANRAKAYDWSDKWDGEFSEIGFTYLEAQKNTIIYDSDEEADVMPSKGYIPVYDETLEPESELIEIPLSSSRGNSVSQYILQEDGSIEEGDVKERLMVVKDGFAAYTTDLWPQNLINNVFKSYKGLVSRPIKVKGTFRLTELDIQGLDYVCPVYLRQMGRYYGIVQVQYKGDESVVELLQLPV